MLALSVALAAPMGAQAAYKPLTEKTARTFALKLARQVAIKRKVRSWQLGRALSVRPNRAVFAYADRNSREIFCTARIVIEQSSLRRRAFFTGSNCNPIPAEALAMERATSAVVRAVGGQRADVRREERRVVKDVAKCEGIVLPRSRHEEYELLLEVADAVAVADPLLAHLDAFVTRLQEIQPEDPDLARGVVWWRRFVTTLSSLPRSAARPCSLMLQWAESDYSSDTAPLDFAQLQATWNAVERENRGITRAAGRLGDLGVAPRLVLAFTPDGLVETALE